MEAGNEPVLSPGFGALAHDVGPHKQAGAATRQPDRERDSIDDIPASDGTMSRWQHAQNWLLTNTGLIGFAIALMLVEGIVLLWALQFPVRACT